MSDVISRDVVDWARDLAHIRDLLAGDSPLDRAFPRVSVVQQLRAASVIPLRPTRPETVA